MKIYRYDKVRVLQSCLQFCDILIIKGGILNLENKFKEIMQYAHYWNWLPDWEIVRKIYNNNNIKKYDLIE